MELTWMTIIAMIWAATKSVLTGGSPFAAKTVLFPTNREGKYEIASEGIRLAFTTHGGALANLWMNDTHRIERDIVLGYENANSYLNYKGNPFLNGVIGRYAGIISGASFDIDGVRYETSANGNGGTSTFNGGEQGWGRRTMDIASHSSNSVTFVIFDRGWNGFPGTPGACITHTVTPYQWNIAIGLTPVRDSSPVSLSQQVFWNLDGIAAETNNTVAQHKLRLPYSGFRFAMDEGNVPTGDMKSNAQGSTFDFWSGERRIKDGQKFNPAGSGNAPLTGIDETFLIARSQPWHKDDQAIAILQSDYSGIKVELYTDQEALHVHPWSSVNDKVSLKKQQGGSIAEDMAAVSMEMHNWPDAINHPEWLRGKETIWGTDQLYTTFSTFKFSLDRK
ncbi:putative aldose 1-epimerase family protein [Stipitochalara longipes BDJ]|nr:putative aldose 1-epimerase family protein [Stipitochalara longipes BDJ]